MRWFVEISQVGNKGAADAILCVEAPQWQPALQKARAHRGDNGALSNFSIELLEEGYRAIDPSTRLRYVVRRAPDDAEVSNGVMSVAPPAVAPGAPSKPPPQPEAALPDPPKKRAPAPTMAYSSSGAASVHPPPEPEAAKPVQPAAAKPASVAPPSASAPESKKRTSVPTVEFASSGSARVEREPAAQAPLPEPPRATPVAATAAAKAAPVAAPPAEPLPSFVVIGSREDNPTDSSPLTYREYVYAVAEGTPEDEAKRLIFERFAHVRSTLDASRTGTLVNLAVFDHIFHGRPQRRPVVTLAWKDWKGEDPEVRYPQREAPASMAPPPAAAAKAVEPAPVAVVAAAVVKPAQASSTLSSAKPVVLPKLEPDSKVSVVEASPIVAKAASAADAKPAAQPAPAPAKAATPAAAAQKPAEAKPAEAKPADAKPAVAKLADAKPADGKPTAAKSTDAGPETRPVPTTATPAAAAPAAAAKPAPAAAAKAAPAAAAPVAKAAAKAAEPAAPKKRLSGDDLLTELFEAFGDLHFSRDSLEGAEFVLQLTLEKLPSEVGLISLFDMNKREFVVVRQVGGPRSALCTRQPERAEPAFGAMRKGLALVISDADGVARAMDERWKAVGVTLKSLVVTPVELSGRYLGLIELANPTDGKAFNEGDGNALTYIGQQFAEFVAARGVIVDPEQIREAAAPAPAPVSLASGLRASAGGPVSAGKKGR